MNTAAAHNAQVTGRIELDEAEQAISGAPKPVHVLPKETISPEEQRIFNRINDALVFICKPFHIPVPIVTDASLRAFGVILKYRMEQRRESREV